VKFSPNEERERERERRKTRGYVSRCPNFIHSHPFVRSFVHLFFLRLSASFLYSFVRSFHSFCFGQFVEEASYFCVMVFAILMEFEFRPVLGSSLLL
jgi:hypothetical protein